MEIKDMEEGLPQIRKKDTNTFVPHSFAEALQLAADLEKEKMMLEQKAVGCEPKVTYLDRIQALEDAMTILQIAAKCGPVRNQIKQAIASTGGYRKVGGQWLLNKKHMNYEYTKFFKRTGRPNS